jgi:hypothetical protein
VPAPGPKAATARPPDAKTAVANPVIRGLIRFIVGSLREALPRGIACEVSTDRGAATDPNNYVGCGGRSRLIGRTISSTSQSAPRLPTTASATTASRCSSSDLVPMNVTNLGPAVTPSSFEF